MYPRHTQVVGKERDRFVRIATYVLSIEKKERVRILVNGKWGQIGRRHVLFLCLRLQLKSTFDTISIEDLIPPVSYISIVTKKQPTPEPTKFQTEGQLTGYICIRRSSQVDEDHQDLVSYLDRQPIMNAKMDVKNWTMLFSGQGCERLCLCVWFQLSEEILIHQRLESLCALCSGLVQVSSGSHTRPRARAQARSMHSLVVGKPRRGTYVWSWCPRWRGWVRDDALKTFRIVSNRRNE